MSEQARVATLKPMQGFIRHLSQQRFTAITGKSAVECRDHPNPGDFIYGSQLAVIQIASSELRLTFKAHFNLSENKSLLPKIRGQIMTPTDSGRRPLGDLFMEYSNLVAGGLQKAFHKNQRPAGISLPLTTTGFDELIASDTLRADRFYDYWILSGEDFVFTCSLSVDILDDKALEGLTFDIQDLDSTDDGALEFL